ncbi:threonine/serine dehydratase [Candidatus Zixiibacteriota bacterium]
MELYDSRTTRDAISGIVATSPLVRSAGLSDHAGTDVWLKLENLQVTGSFKVRGASARMLALTEEERGRGVVTCSSGNHGRAVAYVAERLGIPATICLPEWVDRVKLDAMRKHGAETVLHGSTYDEAEIRSFEIEKDEGLTYVHAFDDPHVISGQGTIALELLEQLPSVRTVVVPLSGGGLLAGITLALKKHDPSIEVIGVSAERARVMHESILAGRPMEFPEEETVASALSGGIGLENSYTFNLVRDLVDHRLLVDETAVLEAMVYAARDEKIVVEGGGAVGIAALLTGQVKSLEGDVAVVVSGGNVDPALLAKVLSG